VKASEQRLEELVKELKGSVASAKNGKSLAEVAGNSLAEVKVVELAMALPVKVYMIIPVKSSLSRLQLEQTVLYLDTALK